MMFIFGSLFGALIPNVRSSSTNAVVRRDDNWDNRSRNFPVSPRQGDLCQFFIKPDLFVVHYYTDRDRFSPRFVVNGFERTALRINIVNRGKGVATDCVAKFRIIDPREKPRHPSPELKTLLWADGTTTKTIYPRGEEEMLNILFADSDMKDAASSGPDIYGLVATPEAYHMRRTRAQEAFGVGDFEAEVSIRSKEGGYCRCILLIHIEQDYTKISIKLSLFDMIRQVYKRRPSLSFLMSTLMRQMIK